MGEEQWKSKWSVVAPLHEGGQGTTYQVHSLTDSAQTGVLKLLQDDSDQQARSRMAHEAINLVTLAKEGVKVPRLLDHNTDRYADSAVQLYLVMEYFEGERLDKAVAARGGRLPLQRSIAIAIDLCQTIGSMHEHDVLHRDLKPANLTVRDFDKADVVVLDLGLSFHRESKQVSLTRTTETIKNELLALPEATTPAGDRRDKRSDITNIVGVLFYCLTGTLPATLRDQRDRAPHHRQGLTMREVLAGDSRWEQVEYLVDTGFPVDIESRLQTIPELHDRLSFVLNPVADVIVDPIQAAREVGARIRRKDRRLQVLEYLPSANAVEAHIYQRVRSIADQAPPFLLALAGAGVNLPLPPGIDLVKEFASAITVGMHTRPHTRIIYLRVGAKGDRCALFRVNRINPPRGNADSTLIWEVIAWFDPTHPPDQKQVASWVDQMSVAAMKEFEAE